MVLRLQWSSDKIAGCDVCYIARNNTIQKIKIPSIEFNNQSITTKQDPQTLQFKLFQTLPNLPQNFSADFTQQSSIHFYYTKISEPDGWRIPLDRWISRSPLVFTLFLRQPFCHLNCFIREGRPGWEVSERR